MPLKNAVVDNQCQNFISFIVFKGPKTTLQKRFLDQKSNNYMFWDATRFGNGEISTIVNVFFGQNDDRVPIQFRMIDKSSTARTCQKNVKDFCCIWKHGNNENRVESATHPCQFLQQRMILYGFLDVTHNRHIEVKYSGTRTKKHNQCHNCIDNLRCIGTPMCTMAISHCKQ